MGDIVKGLTEVQVDNICSTFLICQVTHVIVELYQVGQAGLPLGEAMLTTSDYFLVPNVPRNGFQNLLLQK